jgi:hypothetical protein
MQVSGPNRFVRIRIDRSSADRDVQVMGSLGHQRPYASEVLREAAVTNGATVYSFQRRTATDSNRFETTAAANAGNAVIDDQMEQRAARYQKLLGA